MDKERITSMDRHLNIKLWRGDEQTLATVKDIYLASFPPEEQRPWNDLERRARDGRELRLMVFVWHADVAGFITAWDLGPFLYIEHFATSPALRGGGLGSKALASITGGAGKPVVVEVEREDAGENASRRIGFYKRCGFFPLDNFDYVQPPYTDGQPSVPLLLMSTDPSLDPASIARILHVQIYGTDPNWQKPIRVSKKNP